MFQTLPQHILYKQTSASPSQTEELHRQVKERRDRVAELRKMHQQQVEDAKTLFPAKTGTSQDNLLLKRHSSHDSFKSRSRSNNSHNARIPQRDFSNTAS